jgi:hypothetical protein
MIDDHLFAVIVLVSIATTLVTAWPPRLAC